MARHRRSGLEGEVQHALSRGLPGRHRPRRGGSHRKRRAPGRHRDTAPMATFTHKIHPLGMGPGITIRKHAPRGYHTATKRRGGGFTGI
jgi:hypothetical protein